MKKRLLLFPLILIGVFSYGQCDDIAVQELIESSNRKDSLLVSIYTDLLNQYDYADSLQHELDLTRIDFVRERARRVKSEEDLYDCSISRSEWMGKAETCQEDYQALLDRFIECASDSTKECTNIIESDVCYEWEVEDFSFYCRLKVYPNPVKINTPVTISLEGDNVDFTLRFIDPAGRLDSQLSTTQGLIEERFNQVGMWQIYITAIHLNDGYRILRKQLNVTQ